MERKDRRTRTLPLMRPPLVFLIRDMSASNLTAIEPGAFAGLDRLESLYVPRL
jgi:hypothetical protein